MGESTINKVLGHPLDDWEAAAGDYEVNRTPLARTIADRPLALDRTEDGRRPHWPTRAGTGSPHCRWARSSAGTASASHVTACSTIPRGAASRCPCGDDQPECDGLLPLVERYRYVWVWLGDPAKADSSLVPDMH
jgi:phenylpropionate dioxygenase-like ring-hydroxylating dioxygenase large terminal subunit